MQLHPRFFNPLPQLWARTPSVHGSYHPKFANVAEVMAKQVSRYLGGAAVCVYLEGEKVVDIWCGMARADGSAWQPETMAISYSGTKGIVATCVHMLASEGKIDYDAPVAKYWPEFAQNGKAAITVRQLLSHQAGLHQTLNLLGNLSDILDWDLMVSRLAAMRPAYNPGTANSYHVISFGWLVGELVRRVSGLTLPAFLEQRLSQPLGLDGVYIGGAGNQVERIADIVGLPSIHRASYKPVRSSYPAPTWLPRRLSDWYERGLFPGHLVNIYRHPAFWQASIPAFNGVFTARSLARIYAALSLGGSIDGVRLLKPQQIAQISEVQTRRFDKVAVYPLHWRLGYHRADAFIKNVPEAFGHFGLGGAGGWANPKLKLAAALVHNGFPLLLGAQTRIVMLTAEIYRALGLYKGPLQTLLDGDLVDLKP